MIYNTKYTAFLFYFIAFSFEICAQEKYSLSDCVRTAVERSFAMKLGRNVEKAAELAVKGATNEYIPSLSISNQNNLSTGRVLDPTTYEFVTNRTVYDMSAAVCGSVTLFSGLDRMHNIQKAKMNLQSTLLETEKTRDDLTLSVTTLFMNLVLDKETIVVCENKIEMLRRQEARIQNRLEHKVATKGDLLSIQVDITNALVELSTAERSLDIDRISMCELLEIEDWKSFDITTDGQEYDAIQPRLWNEADVTSSAFRMPQIRQGELALDIAKRDVSIVSSAYFPTLKLNAGYGSTYSNARMKNSGEDYNFRDQLQDNISSYVTLSLNIPILSAINVSNSVRQKRLACNRAEFELARTKLALSKEIKQAIVSANTAYKKYNLLATDVAKFEEALRQTEEKYRAGAATYYDYQIALGNLFQAQSQCLQTKFEYLFRTKIIEFYAGW